MIIQTRWQCYRLTLRITCTLLSNVTIANDNTVNKSLLFISSCRHSVQFKTQFNQQIIIVFFRWNYVFRSWLSRSRLWPQLLVHSTACARAKQTKHYECTSHVLHFLCTLSQVIPNTYYIHFQRFGCNLFNYNNDNNTYHHVVRTWDNNVRIDVICTEICGNDLTNLFAV